MVFSLDLRASLNIPPLSMLFTAVSERGPKFRYGHLLPHRLLLTQTHHDARMAVMNMVEVCSIQ